MKNSLRRLCLLVLLITVTGCAYGYYLGLHGPTIRMYPDVHESATRDEQCLACHHPDHAEGPPTSHPNFTGCLKCHNDDVSP